MTLFKQIAIMLSIFLIIILSTVLVLNFQSANDSVQKRLFEDAKNTASSLSLSLGSANGDITMMSTMINANFDSGNYQFISLEDIEGKTLFSRKSDIQNINTPSWFVNLVNIKAPIASANVSAGWSPIGILNVQSDISYAYGQLYSILKNLIISFIILTIIGLVVLNLLIHTVLKPLKQVQFQAEAVARNEFITQTYIPNTKEFKDVVVGMNTMVQKVKVMFDKGNEELKRQKELEYIDPDTKLKNRKYLIDKLPEYLKIDASSKGGIHMMIAFSGVIEANEKIGHRDVDSLFSESAEIFKSFASNYFNSIVARMNGTEFSILLPDCNDEDGTDLAQAIRDSVSEAMENKGLNTDETYISIGLYEYNYTQSIAQLLSLSDNALAQAKFNDTRIHLDHAEDAIEVMGKDAWREIINKAIERSGFEFLSYKAVDSKSKKDVHNALSISMNVDNQTYYFGQFMAPANQAGFGHDIYNKILEMIFIQPDMKLKDSTCSLRLPYDYLDSKETYLHMQKLFASHASKLPFKLVFEMPDKLISQESETIAQYKELFHKYGFEMAVFEFIGESNDYRYLQDLRPAYIKGEADYYLNQSEQSLSALRLITDSVGISLIATGTMDIQTLEELKKKDIYIVQGRVTEML
ncbi:MAG: diguanylate cyclase [Thiovulaceae bacterium]|nr:diguanylate cyclase [Sulfurimonadaceae bacterium]MCW9027019.1 diguanylate cyclase [Sulfurimonadaceae bacterium]